MDTFLISPGHFFKYGQRKKDIFLLLTSHVFEFHFLQKIVK